MKKVILALGLMLICGQANATTWMIGDNDGYGMGIPDNANHPFDGFNANYDGRSPAEVAATDGAQYTDTYSTTHGTYGPADQTGDVATFLFSGLGSGWTEGSMWFDMADFQASLGGAVAVTFNNIAQNWAFDDGFPTTVVRFFDLAQDVLDSINLLGSLTIAIDRNNSGDFYGFDYAMLSDRTGDNTVVPEPATILLFGAGIAGLAGYSRKRCIRK